MKYWQKTVTSVITNTSYNFVMYDESDFDHSPTYTETNESAYNTFINTTEPIIERERVTLRTIKRFENYGTTPTGTIGLGNIEVINGTTESTGLSRFTGTSSVMPPVYARQSSWLNNKYIVWHPNLTEILYSYDKDNVSSVDYLTGDTDDYYQILLGAKHTFEDTGQDIPSGLISELNALQSNLTNNSTLPMLSWTSYKARNNINTQSN